MFDGLIVVDRATDFMDGGVVFVCEFLGTDGDVVGLIGRIALAVIDRESVDANNEDTCGDGGAFPFDDFAGIGITVGDILACNTAGKVGFVEAECTNDHVTWSRGFDPEVQITLCRGWGGIAFACED